jgi:hypothetical protein
MAVLVAVEDRSGWVASKRIETAAEPKRLGRNDSPESVLSVGLVRIGLERAHDP